MQREELSKLIDNLVEQAIKELRADKGNAQSNTKALVIVPHTVFSLHKYENYFLDTCKDLDFTFASFFDSSLYREKNQSIEYIYLNAEGQVNISNKIDDFDKLFIIVNDITAIDNVLSGECDAFVRELIGYYNMHEKNTSLVTSYKNSLKMNTAVKSRGAKLRSNRIDIININKDAMKTDYDSGMIAEKKVITEKEINEAHSAGVDVLELNRKQLITPLAKDRARNYGIKIAY